MRQQKRLIALNLTLLGVLAIVTLAPAGGADAQPGQPRGRGAYSMITGEVTGDTTAVLYVVDAANQELVALSYDRTTNRLGMIGYRNLAEDARRQSQQR